MLVKKYSLLFFSYYFLFFALCGCLNMLSATIFNGSFSVYSGMIFDVFIIVLALPYILIKKDILDWFLLIIIISISLIGIIGSHPLLYRIGLEAEIIPMFAYFIGKNVINERIGFFEKGVPVLICVGLIGLFLFFSPPSWYISFKLDSLSNTSDNMILEMTRLSAFWKSAYWLSYGTAIIYIFLLESNLRNKRRLGWKELVVLLFFVIVVLLTMQRAAIGIVALSTGVLVYIYEKNKFGMTIKWLAFFSLFILLIIQLSNFYLSTEHVDFFISKFDVFFSGDDSNFFKHRADLFSNFYKNEITIFGDGLGVYGHAALSLYRDAITDQGYLKMLYETGLWGLFSRVVFIIIIFVKGVRFKKERLFECLVILFFMIAMFGANSLSSPEEHNVIFWYCCGRVCIKNRMRTRELPCGLN